MRWPLVTRARLDATLAQVVAEVRYSETVKAEADRRIDEANGRTREANARADREAGRVDVLTKFILRMKAQGAVLLPDGSVQATRVPHQPKRMTPIEQAIDDNPRARASLPLRKRLNAYAEQATREGKDEEAIVETLRTWGQVTHDDDDEESAFD